MQTTGGGGGALVGRAAEVGQSLAALRNPGGAVLVGPAGVGKTRIAAEVLARVHDRPVARIVATRSAAGVPLGALAPLLAGDIDPAANPVAAARRALLDRTADRPLVLLVDDAHLLDDASAAVVWQLADEGRLAVLATLRSGEPVPDAVTSLWKDGRARRIDVEPLDGDQVDAVAADLLGGELDPLVAAEIRRLAAGLPLAVREIVAGAEANASLVRGEAGWTLAHPLSLPARLTELVGARLAELAPDARAALELIALGEPLPVGWLLAAVGERAVDGLDDAGLLEVRDDDQGACAWLAHPLHGEVVRMGLTGLRRRRLVERLAGFLDPSAANPRDRLRVVRWRLEAGSPVDPDVLLAAAADALRAVGVDVAAELAGRAWAVRPDAESGHLLGNTLCSLGRHARAEAVLAEATTLVTDDRTRVLVAMARSENLFRDDQSEAAASVVAVAEGTVLDEGWRAELVGHGATLTMLGGEPAVALAAVAPLLDGDGGRPFVEAAIVAGCVLPYDGRPEDGLAIAERAYARHQELWTAEPFQSSPDIHVISMLFCLTQGGRLREAEALAELVFDQVTAEGSPEGIPFLALQRALVLNERGHLRAASGWFIRAATYYERYGPRSRGRLAQLGVLRTSAILGRLDAARAASAALEENGALRFNEVSMAIGRAWLANADGRRDVARTTLLEAAEHATAVGNRTNTVMAASDLARLGFVDDAVAVADSLAIEVQGPLLQGRLARIGALAAGDASALASIGGRFDEIGADLDAAEAWAEAAAAHRRAGAARSADRCAAVAEELAERCGVRTPPLASLTAAEPLSVREREIALLAAGGFTSKAIAERLVLSRRTVDNHLAHAYRKLAVAGRDELAVVFGGEPARP